MPPRSRRQAVWRSRPSDFAERPFGPYDALCALLCLGAAVLLASGLLGRVVWAADVANLFRPYLALATALVLLACLLARRSGLVILAALLTLGEVSLTGAAVLRSEALPPAAAGGRVIKAVSFNCLGSNPDVSTFVAWVRAAKPDVLVLEELPDGWSAGLGTLGDMLPYRASQLQATPGDTDIFSRLPMTSAEGYRPAADLRTLVHAVVRVDGLKLQVFGLHPNTLQTPSEWDNRNAALELSGQWIAERLQRGGGPALALGDWNTPPWSPYFARFLRISGLRAADPLAWPPMTRILAHPFGIRLGSSIDHIAATPDVRTLGCETGPQMGSDHAPQICRLVLPSGAPLPRDGETG